MLGLLTRLLCDCSHSTTSPPSRAKASSPLLPAYQLAALSCMIPCPVRLLLKFACRMYFRVESRSVRSSVGWSAGWTAGINRGKEGEGKDGVVRGRHNGGVNG